MKTRNRAAMLGLIAALTACPQALGPDTTSPTILSSAPSSGATGVAASASLSVHFSEPMDKATVTASSSPAINLGAPVWNDAQTVVFSPSAWQLGTNYTVNLDGKDLAGDALGGAKTISFQTIATADTTPPATPNGIKATPGDAAFVLEWNADTETDLEGYTVYWGTSANVLTNATFIAKPTTIASIKGLENATAYFYAVDAVDTSGNHSAKSTPASVTPVDKTAPSLTSSEPADGTLDIALVPSLRFSFSEPMNTASLEFGLCVKTDPPASATCDTPSLASFGTPTWSENDTQVQFTPSSDFFKGGKTYVIVLFGKDKAGNALSGSARIAFATRATPDTTPPTVVSSNATVTDPTAKIALTFSEPMDQTSVQNAFLSQPPISCAWTWSGNTATCSTGALIQSTQYTVTIGIGAADTAQNHLQAPKQVQFATPNFAPRVTNYAPKPSPFGGGFSPPNTPITLTFSEAMNQQSLNQGLIVYIYKGASQLIDPLGGTRSWNAEGTQVTFTPTTPYGNGKTIAWIVNTGVTDAGGKAVAAPVNGSFQTEPVNQLGTSR